MHCANTKIAAAARLSCQSMNVDNPKKYDANLPQMAPLTGPNREAGVNPVLYPQL